MDCNYIPQVRDNEGNLHESMLFKNLLTYTANRDLAVKVYKATRTETFKDWFGNSSYVDILGEPQIYFNKDNDIAFLNWKQDVKVIRNAKTRNFNVTESSIMQDLVDRKIVNHNRRYGEYLLPRPLQGSFDLENFYSDKMKPETSVALGQIRELNQEYKDRFGITEDVVLVYPFGKTYSVKVNTSLVESLQSQPSYVVAKRPGGNQFDVLRRYKENLISNLNERLQSLAMLKKDPNNTNVKDLARIMKARTVIESRIEQLKNELKEIDKATGIADVNAAVQLDLERMERLATSSDYADLDEAMNLANYYSHSDPDVNSRDHCIFTKDELDALSPYDKEMMEEWARRAMIIKNAIDTKRMEEYIETINNRSYVQKTFNGTHLTPEQIFHIQEGLRDINWFDMFLMDITGGVFSSNGIIPQDAMIALQAAHDSHAAYVKEKLEKLDKLTRPAEDAIGALEGGKYKLSRYIMKPAHAVSWKIFFQKDIDGTMTGSLVNRYSRVWEDAEADMRSRFHSLQENVGRLQALIFKREWYKSNSVILDVTNYPELMDYIQDPANGMDFLIPYAVSVNATMLKSSPNHTKELVNKQKELLKLLKYNYEARVEIAIEQENVADYAALSPEGKESLRIWLIQNNPFSAYNTVNWDHNAKRWGIFETGVFQTQTGAKTLPIYSTFDYSVKVPRTRRMDSRGVLKEETGYYDKEYEAIDKSSALYEFYQVAVDLIEYHRNTLPEDLKKFAPALALGLTPKGIADILYDPTHGAWEKTLEALGAVKKNIKEMSFVKPQSMAYKGKLDLINNKKLKQVNSHLVQGSLKNIEAEFTIEKARFIAAFNRGNAAKITDITKNTRKSELLLNPEAVALLAEYLDVAPSINVIKNKLKLSEFDTNGDPVPVNIPVGRIINNFVTNKVVETTTMNLPMSLNLFSKLAADYAAKRSVKPFIDTAKKFYEDIKNTSLNNMGQAEGTESGPVHQGERDRAKRQFEDWYNRGVLGYYESIHSGIRSKSFLSARNKVREMLGKPKLTEDKIIHYTEEEKEQRARIDEQIANLTTSPEDLILKAQLEAIKEQMGYVKTFTKAVENLLNFIRLRRLGWNLNSALTNFLEGQIANEIAMATGYYYSPENWYKATRVVRLARRKALSRGKVTHPMANLVSILMERYTVLQDSRNEFQRAGIKASFSLLEKLDPMLLNQSVEYLNQAPILLTAVMSQDISDGNGGTVKLIDALDWNTGRLKPEYRTEENIENWEQMKGSEYQSFKATINQCIVDTHGDYDRLRGNIAKAGLGGKALLMFKGWLPRAVYMRFAVEQTQLATGKKHKGRYRSHTRATATLHGAITGAAIVAPFGLGLFGAPVGALAGYLIHTIYSDTRSDLSYLQELGLSTFLLVKKMVGVPVNRLGNKERVHSTTVADLANMGFVAASTGDNKFTEVDRRNMLGNLTEMAITLSWIGLTLLTKFALFDDDDDEEDARRMAHNILANRCITMGQQATMYMNPSTFYQDNVAGVAVLRFLVDVGKLTQDIGKAMGGDNIDDNPANRGGNRVLAQARKTLAPAPIQPWLGFASQAEKQFLKTPYDKWFESDLKRLGDKIEDERAKKKLSMEQSGEYTSEQIKDIMNSAYPTLSKQLESGVAVFIIKQEDIPKLREAKKRKKAREKARIVEEDAKILEKKRLKK